MCEVEIIEAHSVIKFRHFKINNDRQIHGETLAVYGNDCLFYGTIVRWKRNFQSGQMPLTEEPGPGKPSLTDDEVTVKKVECLILEDIRGTIQMIMNETGLSYGSV